MATDPTQTTVKDIPENTTAGAVFDGLLAILLIGLLVLLLS